MVQEIQKLLDVLFVLDPELEIAIRCDLSHGELTYSEQTEDLLQDLVEARQN